MIVEQDLPCRVSGRYLTGDELALIRRVIAENPATSRAEITRPGPLPRPLPAGTGGRG